MIGRKRPLYYIQSKPPDRGLFVHHAHYAALKNIANQHGCLTEGKRYRGISLTTDPGRFVSPLPLFAPTVDGFVEFPSEPLTAENLVVPCLYRTVDKALVQAARERGHAVYGEKEIPLEYKFVLRFVLHVDIFLGENEWVYLGEYLNLPEDYKVYISRRLFRRFLKSVTGPKGCIVCMDATR